ncbi:lipoprotein CseA precursor [Streptomyces jeddahensis]|uniref:Lipoprotein CseA n=1 Tax=Streptomyces jeddahensis TaxID=1716141 RepID=A0A177HI28_9ACTN|nr:lipoprotein CseA precursor [Streptomyces jeddahensis]
MRGRLGTRAIRGKRVIQRLRAIRGDALAARRGGGRTGKRTLTAGGAAAAALAALGLTLTGCGAGGTGARDEGPARGASVAQPTPSPSPSHTVQRVDAVALVKNDPTVSAEVKRDLKPCVADEYPVDVSYGKLTGGASNDIVVNVMTCGDAVGVGSYVYRMAGGRYQNVFRAEEPPVYAEIDRGDLVVTMQVYEKGDPVEYPSGENVITYHWSANRFVEQSLTHNDYSNAVGGGSPTTSQH